MANLVGQGPIAHHSDTSVIDATQKIPLGTEAKDRSGNTYKYLQGIGSTVAGSVVIFDNTGLTALVTGAAVGPVAVAMAAILASQFGWYAVDHLGVSTNTDAGIASGALAYVDGTAGRADDTVVATDLIHGAFFRSVDTANFSTMQITRPHLANLG